VNIKNICGYPHNKYPHGYEYGSETNIYVTDKVRENYYHILPAHSHPKFQVYFILGYTPQIEEKELYVHLYPSDIVVYNCFHLKVIIFKSKTKY